jgi:hypothetical protein
MQEVVVLTIKGWDGSRILGVYSCIEKAKLCQESFMKDNTNVDYFKEEFEFDIINIDNLSIGTNTTVSSEHARNTLVRKHIYEQD